MNSHHIVAMIRVDTDLKRESDFLLKKMLSKVYLGTMSLPCCMRDPTANHIVFTNENSLTRTCKYSPLCIFDSECD